MDKYQFKFEGKRVYMFCHDEQIWKLAGNLNGRTPSQYRRDYAQRRERVERKKPIGKGKGQVSRHAFKIVEVGHIVAFNLGKNALMFRVLANNGVIMEIEHKDRVPDTVYKARVRLVKRVYDEQGNWIKVDKALYTND